MMSSTLTFPPETSGSVRLVLRSFDKIAATVASNPKFISPTSKFGPLELRLQAVAFEGAWVGDAGILPYPMLARAAAAEGFPWTGTVEGHFRILDAEGKCIKYDEPLGSIQVSQETSPSPYWSPWACRVLRLKELKDYVENDALHLEFLFVVKISLGLRNGDCLWKIPLSLLEMKSATANVANASLWTSKDWSFSDVKIESRERDRIPAHRVILAGSSRVFKTEMKKVRKGEYETMKWMTTKALKLMLKFIYTGGFCKEMKDVEGHNAEVFLELLEAGKKYEMLLLMKFAGVALMLRCTPKNALEVLLSLKEYGEGMREVSDQVAEYVKKTVDDL